MTKKLLFEKMGQYHILRVMNFALSWITWLGDDSIVVRFPGERSVCSKGKRTGLKQIVKVKVRASGGHR